MDEPLPPKRPGLRLEIQPENGGEPRSIHLTWPQLRSLSRLGLFGTALLLLMMGTWWYVAGGYHITGSLPARVVALEQEQAQLAHLSEQLEDLEALYAQVWTMLGGDRPSSGVFWTPPPFALSEQPLSLGPENLGPEVEPPSGWPLTERGFLSQPLSTFANLERGGHTGIDLAVPSGTYLLAVASGEVTVRGEDPVYGLYLVLQHEGGWETRYAHASLFTVDVGDRVQEGEVLGLSGSSGQSTAPHLHLELLHEGVPVDPLLYLKRP